MCEFTGIINKNSQPVISDLLSRMASTIHHRGPDDEGSFMENQIGFYHKRLSIIDLPTGHQPMVFDELVIVYNGEIYNYIELREH